MSSGEILGLFEITHVLVGHDYGYWMFCSCEIIMPFFECLNDRQKFSVVDVVVLFCGGEGCRVIGTGVEISVGIFLHEDSSCCREQGISHDKEWFGGIWHFDHWGGEEDFF